MAIRDVTPLAWVFIHRFATGLENPQPKYDEDVLDREESDYLLESHNFKDFISWKLITNNFSVFYDSRPPGQLKVYY